MSKLARRLVFLVGFLVLGACYLMAVHWFEPWRLAQTDRYFHLALARMTAQVGIVRSLPQIDDLFWTRGYPEKEFLFHLWAGLGFKLSREPGALLFGHLAALGSLGVMMLIGRAVRLSVLSAGLILCATLLMTESYVAELVLFKADGLSQFFFAALIFGLLKRWWPLTLMSALAFALTNHAVYVPTLMLAVIAMVAFRPIGRGDEYLLRAVGTGLSGILLGVLINPFFPRNVLFIQSDFLGLLKVDVPAFALLGNLFPLSVITGVLAWIALRSRSLDRELFVRHRDFAAWLGVAVLFWVTSSFYARSAQFLVPVTAIVLMYFVAAQQKPERAAGLVFLAAVFLQLPAWALFAGHDERMELARQAGAPQVVLQALEHVSRDRSVMVNRPLKIFNCEPETGNLILYARPDLKFVDALDEYFLESVDSLKVSLRNSLIRGSVPDPRSLLREVFNADYLLCASDATAAQLATDPNFRRVYPPADQSGVAPGTMRLFEVAWLPDSSVVHDFKLSTGQKVSTHGSTSWVNYWIWVRQHQLKPGCLTAEPSAEELVRHEGAKAISLAGGSLIEASFDGKRIFANTEASDLLVGKKTRISLPRPLKRTDRLRITVCPRLHSKAYWFTLSMHTGRN